MPGFQILRGDSISRLSPRTACATGKDHPDYDLPLHVGGLFIILFVSGSGCFFPSLVRKFPRMRIPPTFLFSANHFETGVLIATAFVHLLPTAFLSLSNPCLANFWASDYQAMPGAIMLASIFFVTMIEMIFSPAQLAYGGSKDVAAVSRQPEDWSNEKEQTVPQKAMRRTDSDSSMRVREIGTLRGRMTITSRTLSRYHEDRQRLDVVESVGLEPETPVEDPKHMSNESAAKGDPESDQYSHVLTPEQIHKKAVMQVFLLEMGILFHSIFIGMSLAVAVGHDFVVLLIAIIFHQTFEGLALGVRIADIKWPARAWQPWLMPLAYCCTTPLGQAIGIATHTLQPQRTHPINPRTTGQQPCPWHLHSMPHHRHRGLSSLQLHTALTVPVEAGLLLRARSLGGEPPRPHQSLLLPLSSKAAFFSAALLHRGDDGGSVAGFRGVGRPHGQEAAGDGRVCAFALRGEEEGGLESGPGGRGLGREGLRFHLLDGRIRCHFVVFCGFIRQRRGRERGGLGERG